jgi:hypothetical protein
VARRYAAMGYTLANAPDRQEVIEIEADDGHELLQGTREIIRPASGRPHLGKLEVFRPKRIQGRFLDLLPRQRSEPLPRSDAALAVMISHDPVISMRNELHDRVMQWVFDGINRGLKCAEGGFCFDGIDYRVAYWPGDGGEVKAIVMLERGGSIKPPKPSRPPPWGEA